MKQLKTSDALLVRRYVEGDEQALDILINRYRHKLYGYILSRVKNKDVAEDIFQDTFIKIIHTLKEGRYSEEGKFGSWLMRIAHNLIIDHFRREKRSRLSRDTADFNLLATLTDNKPAETQLIRSQTVEKMREFIERLPEEQKTVLKMRIYDEIPFKEIAEHQNISINTALGRMRYAILNLRKMIKKENPF
ncbi:MAG: sigma-70 family RNA polymerase sigma factor [Chlorobi bacterium]|nr:sigma-70 family RNA polymerase sigma factor [Chlorobiota bacterium]